MYATGKRALWSLFGNPYFLHILVSDKSRLLYFRVSYYDTLRFLLFTSGLRI
jgi:hypothetical protein